TDLQKSVARRIVDRRVLHLIRMWLECPVEETDQRGRTRRTTEGRDSLSRDNLDERAATIRMKIRRRGGAMIARGRLSRKRIFGVD
ncbi:MAG TPA: hypothetical protein VMI47_02710, partial [Pseudolabrys sp.]|nr:hypothetical protein [Pseudolabrys sp.]